MKFIYYIVTLDDGTVYGTNDEEKVAMYSASEEAFVINADSGTWIVNKEDVDIEELP